MEADKNAEIARQKNLADEQAAERKRKMAEVADRQFRKYEENQAKEIARLKKIADDKEAERKRVAEDAALLKLEAEAK